MRTPRRESWIAALFRATLSGVLTASDIIAAKVVIQLKLAPAEKVRAELRALARPDAGTRDLVQRLADAGQLGEKAVEVVRHRAALYEHVRGESSYLRLLERGADADKASVARLIYELERSAFRRRLGDVLVDLKKLKKEQDRSIAEKVRAALEKEDEKIVKRYVAEDYEGVVRPLIPGSGLEPAAFKISTLFRGKETRALVDEARIKALSEEIPDQALDEAKAPTAKWEPDQGKPPPPTPAPVPDRLAASFEDAGRDDDDDEEEADDEDDEPIPEPASATKSGQLRSGLERIKKLKRIGAYRVLQVLGAGGMGAVVLGQKDGVGEMAAIKIMLNGAAGERERGRFAREIALTQRVKHKNVIGIIESGETKHGMSYLVVPALVGRELRALLVEMKGLGLPPADACTIFDQVLDGMAAVHAERIVHRDLKPENVMLLGSDRQVKIMDFGLAKLDDEADAERGTGLFQTKKFEVVGSPAYIAPESVTRDKIDARTDIYSLGVMFFEMLTGRLPIEADDPGDYLQKHMICPPLTLHEARGGREHDWPPEAESLLARMLAKTRDERPPSCRAIQEELRKGLAAKLTAMAKTARELPPVAEPTRSFSALLGRLLGKK